MMISDRFICIVWSSPQLSHASMWSHFGKYLPVYRLVYDIHNEFILYDPELLGAMWIHLFNPFRASDWRKHYPTNGNILPWQVKLIPQTSIWAWEQKLTFSLYMYIRTFFKWMCLFNYDLFANCKSTYIVMTWQFANVPQPNVSSELWVWNIRRKRKLFTLIFIESKSCWTFLNFDISFAIIGCLNRF